MRWGTVSSPRFWPRCWSARLPLRSEYVTGQLARVNLRSGTAQIINAGHPPPLRVRDGRVSYVDLRPDLPFGLGEHSYQVQPLPLAQGDRLVFLTDGLGEQNGPDIDIQALVAQSTKMHPREAVQHIIQAVLHATQGQLKDDATVMCLDWHIEPDRLRTSDSGANV
jgi:serine phosphatase RsbU (regulator of sigma subunit)